MEWSLVVLVNYQNISAKKLNENKDIERNSENVPRISLMNGKIVMELCGKA